MSTQELLNSGYLTEVHKFSKFIHGTATLMPDMVQVGPQRAVTRTSIRTHTCLCCVMEEWNENSNGAGCNRLCRTGWMMSQSGRPC